MMNRKAFIPLILLTLSSSIWSATDSTLYRTKKSYFKLGIITQYLSGSKYLKSGFTGVGFLFEPQFTPEFSVAVILSSLDIHYKNELARFYHSDFSHYELNVKVRYHINLNKYSLFPEMGIGGWGKDIAISIIGAGIQYNMFRNISATAVLDYTNMCEDCLSVGGGGSGDHFYRFNVSLNYFFTITDKIKKSAVN
jgi:hypothetical protein